METIKTNVHVKELFDAIQETAPWLGYETIQDFIDHVIRCGFEDITNLILARDQSLKQPK